MDKMGRGSIGLGILALALAASGAAPGQTATAPAASGPASNAAPAATPAKKPTVEELLSATKPVSFDFSGKPMQDVLDYVARSFGIEIVNHYPLTDQVTITLGDLSAREAINILNSSILVLGYTVLESVRGDPPHVVLTIVPTTKMDAGAPAQVFFGNDPDTIPEGEARRTQVMNVKAADLQKTRDTIVAVVGKQAEITVNPANKTIIITDTASHVHTAAALLQMLEKQAADNK